jgi:Predicted membrane protein (DUF2232)
MDILLVPIILLLVMYVTARSFAAGVLASGVLTGGALWLTRGGPAPAPLWNAVGMVTSGLLLGGLSRGKVAPRHVLTGATVPLALVLAYGALTWEREALARRLDEAVRFQVGDAMPAEMRAEMTSFLLGLAPASAALIGFGLVLAAYAVAARVFPRFGVFVPPLGPFGHLRLPFGLVWSFAAGLALAIFGHATDRRGLFLAGVNVTLIHGAAFLAAGLAVGQHVLAARGIPRGMRWLGGVIALLVMPMPFLIAGIGLLDFWLDFRRLTAPPEETGDRSVED